MPSSRGTLVAAAATIAAVATAVFAFAYDRGGYPLESRDLAGVLVWSAVAFGLAAGVWRGRRLSAAALAAGGLLTALAAFAGVSAAWAPSTERALDDFCRTLLYSGAFVVVALSASRRSRGRWLDGLALAITAVAAVALVSRFFPSIFGSGAVLRLSSGPVWRLSFPVGYWNGLAVMVALSVPMLLRAALMPLHLRLVLQANLRARFCCAFVVPKQNYFNFWMQQLPALRGPLSRQCRSTSR